MNRRAVGPRRRPGVDEKFSRTSGVRPTTLFLALLLASATIFVSAIGLGGQASAITTPPDRSVATEQSNEPVPSAAVITNTTSTPANDFIPEDRDLTSCIGVLERPGCGSESRGGWRQTLIVLALFGGLAVVFGNIARGVRKNRREQQR